MNIFGVESLLYGVDDVAETGHWTAQEHATIPHGGSSWYIRREDEGLRPGHGAWPQFSEPAPTSLYR